MNQTDHKLNIFKPNTKVSVSIHVRIELQITLCSHIFKRNEHIFKRNPGVLFIHRKELKMKFLCISIVFKYGTMEETNNHCYLKSQTF